MGFVWQAKKYISTACLLIAVLQFMACGSRNTGTLYNNSKDQPAVAYSARLASPSLKKVWHGSSSKIWIAVGEGGQILRSQDGITLWSKATNKSTSDLVSATGDSTGKVLIAAGKSGTILRSVNEGRDWDAVTIHWKDERRKTDFAAVAADESGEKMVAIGSDGGVLRSENGGQIWTEVESGTHVDLTDVINKPQTSVLIAVGAAGVILRSDDWASTWTQVYSDTKSDLFSASYEGLDRLMVAVGKDGAILRSQNDGQTWSPLTSGSKETNIQLHKAIGCHGNGAIIVIGNNGTILRSSDGGNKWITPKTGGSDLNSIVADSEGKLLLAAGNQGLILRSDNSGETWKVIKSGTKANLQSVTRDENKLVAVGGGGAVLYSEDEGSSWKSVPKHEGRRTLKFLSIAGDVSGKSLIAAGKEGIIMRSANSGADWEEVNSTVQTDLAGVIRDETNSTAIAVGANGVILRSLSAGSDWNRIDSSTGEYLHAITGDPRGTLVAVGNRGVIVRSENGGQKWKPRESHTTADLLNVTGNVASGKFVAVGSSGAILLSVDGGVSWEPKTSGTKSYLQSLCTDTANNIYLATGSSGAIVRSTDGGETWTEVKTANEKELVSIAGDPQKTLIVVGAEGTILRSQDTGETWNPVIVRNKQGEYVSSQVNSGADDLNYVWSDANAQSWLAVGSRGRILRSEDSGQTWLAIDSHIKANFVRVIGNEAKQFTAVGDRILLIHSQRKKNQWPAVRKVEYTTGLNGVVNLTVGLSAQDLACPPENIHLLGWLNAKSPNLDEVKQIKVQWKEQKLPGKESLLRGSFNPKTALRASPGDQIYLKLDLTGKEFSIRYPREGEFEPISYQVNQTVPHTLEVVGALLIITCLIYLLRPLWLLTVSRKFSAVKVVLGMVPAGNAVADVIEKLLILPWVTTLPRVLDAWISGEGSKFARRFELLTETSDLVFCALPVTRVQTAERITSPTQQTFQSEFYKTRVLMVFLGPGGSGKTSLAIQMARWGLDSKLTPYRIPPLWIDEDVKDPEKWLVEKVRVIAEDPGLPENFVQALLRKKRLLIVLDRLSERKHETQEAWTRHLPEFARCIIVTARNEDFKFEVDAFKYLLEPLGPGTLSSFIEHLLGVYDTGSIIKRLNDRGELLKRLADVVTLGSEELPVTPLLTKLFVRASLQRISQIEGPILWSALPASIPDVYLSFIKSVNPTGEGISNALSTEDLYRVVKTLAVAEIGQDYRPKFLRTQDARGALEKITLSNRSSSDPIDPLQRLIDNQILRRVEEMGNVLVRFELDPVAEQLAALAHAERCGSDLGLWNGLIESVIANAQGRHGFLNALTIVYRAYGKDNGWPTVIFPAGNDLAA